MRKNSEERICISESSNVQGLAIDVELISLGQIMFKSCRIESGLSWLSQLQFVLRNGLTCW